MKGIFYGVGVGPGDPELITLKGYRILQEVDVICSPKSNADKEGVALSIVSNLLDLKQTILELPFPMISDKAELELCWNEAVNQILNLLKEGKKVAFVTLGDPSLYSTYTYVLKKIKQAGSYEIKTIPGVTSFCACAAAAGIPLAEGDEKLAIIPATADLSALHFVLHNFENIVLMKGVKKYHTVVKILEELDLKYKAVYASRCGLPGGFLETNPDGLPKKLKETQKDYLSLIIIKKEEAKPDP